MIDKEIFSQGTQCGKNAGKVVTWGSVEGELMDSVNMLVSGIINKEGRRFARVSFIRGRDIAEGIVPEGIVDHAEGFSDAEVAKLERYLRENQGEIMEQARQVNPIKNWLGLV